METFTFLKYDQNSPTNFIVSYKNIFDSQDTQLHKEYIVNKPENYIYFVEDNKFKIKFTKRESMIYFY